MTDFEKLALRFLACIAVGVALQVNDDECQTELLDALDDVVDDVHKALDAR